MIHIGIIGELLADRKPRNTIVPALTDSANSLNIKIQSSWITNTELSVDSFDKYDGFLIAPGSPLEETSNIIEAIRYARENDIPCIGTCGGFQRIITEFAINKLQMINIKHQEKDPEVKDPLFSMLACSIASTKSEVKIVENTKAHKIYGTEISSENFYCSFGLNNLYREQFENEGLCISASDDTGSARIVELPEHPFFFGTLFVPQVDSTKENPHPLITEFVRVINERSKN